MNEESKKTVDESWKEQVRKEKDTAQNTQAVYHEPNFTLFISSLGMQAMIAMGKLENPITGTSEKNFDQARYLIDTLSILQEKTKNNLTAEESKFLEESLFNLRMIYVDERKENDS